MIPPHTSPQSSPFSFSAFQLFSFCLLVAGCSTTAYPPSPSAQAQIRLVDLRVASLVTAEFDRFKPTFEDGENLANYFGLCAQAIDNAARKQSPNREDVQADITGIRCVGYTPEALEVACSCLDFYTPLADPRDSSAVLLEISQEIRMGCPGGYPWWYLPKKQKAESRKLSSEVQSPKAQGL